MSTLIFKSALLLLFGVLLTTSLSPAHAETAMVSAAPDAYEMLERFGFPRGILPEGVESYLLREDGSFEVYLGGNGDCDFSAEGGYVLNYKRKITGRVEYSGMRLGDLKGVTVKVFLVWLGISEVVVGDGELSLYVGPLSASFPLSNFEKCPRCSGGVYDCSTNAAAPASIDVAAGFLEM